MNVMSKSFAYGNMQTMPASSMITGETVRARRDRQYAEIDAQLARIGMILHEAEQVMDALEAR
jgi:hypothetical protein